MDTWKTTSKIERRYNNLVINITKQNSKRCMKISELFNKKDQPWKVKEKEL